MSTEVFSNGHHALVPSVALHWVSRGWTGGSTQSSGCPFPGGLQTFAHTLLISSLWAQHFYPDLHLGSVQIKLGKPGTDVALMLVTRWENWASSSSVHQVPLLQCLWGDGASGKDGSKTVLLHFTTAFGSFGGESEAVARSQAMSSRWCRSRRGPVTTAPNLGSEQALGLLVPGATSTASWDITAKARSSARYFQGPLPWADLQTWWGNALGASWACSPKNSSSFRSLSGW